MTKKKITLSTITTLDGPAKAYLARLTPDDIAKMKPDELARLQPRWVAELDPAARQALKLVGWMARIEEQIAAKQAQLKAYREELKRLK